MIKSIWHTIIDKPLKSVPAAFITGDGVLAVTGGITDNPWLLGGNLVGAAAGVALAIGGDGGDPATRTPQEIAHAERYERFAMNAVIIQGVSFIGSGVFEHPKVNPEEIFLGVLCTAGALCAQTRQHLTPTKVSTAVREVVTAQFAKSAQTIRQIPPYKKAGVIWLTSQAPLIMAYADNGILGYAVAAGLYIAGNIQVMRSWKADSQVLASPAA